MKSIKIKGVTIGKHPTIPILFEVPSVKKSKIINFLIDTGSTFSAITEKEATLMGLDCSQFPDTRGPAIGFGGWFKTKMINRLVILTFKAERGEWKYNYSNGFRIVCCPENLKGEEREKFLRYVPCVLGMEILTKFDIFINKDKVEFTLNE